ncbi:hypothetical protein DS300_15560 [Salmonella enterica subsp. enterica]|nr:hypothetical protein [Salmonella enterica subsp. enterica serovar Potsdam]
MRNLTPAIIRRIVVLMMAEPGERAARVVMVAEPGERAALVAVAAEPGERAALVVLAVMIAVVIRRLALEFLLFIILVLGAKIKNH